MIFKSGDKLHWVKNLYLRWKNGAGCCDTYNLDNYLAKKIVMPLKEFRKRADGYPSNLESFSQWTEILDEMIWAFDNFLADDDLPWDKGGKEQAERQRKGFELFGKYFTSLWY